MNEKKGILNTFPLWPIRMMCSTIPPNSSACSWINPMKASPTTAKDSAVLTSLFVMEVSSVIKGGMGFVGLTNLEKKKSSILTPEQS
jgi:hypothetical protein